VSDSMAAMAIVRTDFEKEVSFIVVGSKGFSESNQACVWLLISLRSEIAIG
jgi:hypothetical protein